MRIRLQDRTEQDINVSDIELLHLVLDSLGAIRQRSAIVECDQTDCGRRFLVNTQDFHQVHRCPLHR